MTAAAELELLRCPNCNIGVPLQSSPRVTCTSCGTEVTIPSRHAEALRAATEGRKARDRVAVALQQLAKGPSPGLIGIGAPAIVLLPPLATYLAERFSGLAFSNIELMVYAALPATLPGIWLVLWAAAASGTSARFCDALSALPSPEIKGQLSCRSCGAPLGAPEKGHVRRCAYCGSDNLMRDIKVGKLLQALSSSLRTLDQATRLMRLRRATWGLGMGFACALVLGALTLVYVMVG